MLFVLFTISKFISKFNLFLSQSHRSSLATHGSASNLYINLRDFDCKWIKLFVITYQQETYIYNKGVICLLHDFLENERDRYVYRYHRIMSYIDNLRLNLCGSSVHMHLWVTFVLPRRLRFLTNTNTYIFWYWDRQQNLIVIQNSQCPNDCPIRIVKVIAIRIVKVIFIKYKIKSCLSHLWPSPCHMCGTRWCVGL